MSKKKKYPLFYIEWEDAVTNSEWFGEEQANTWVKDTSMVIREVGFLMEENKEYIAFCGRISEWGTHEQPELGSLHKIPKTWIRQRIPLQDFVDSQIAISNLT